MCTGKWSFELRKITQIFSEYTPENHFKKQAPFRNNSDKDNFGCNQVNKDQLNCRVSI